MNVNRFIYRSTRYFTSAVIVSGCLFASSAHAVFVAEVHACKPGSKTGGSWIGGYFYPASRSAATIQRNQKLPNAVHINVELWAYPENGRNATVVRKHAVTQSGVLNNQAVAIVTDSKTAPGHALNVYSIWSPTITRFGGLVVGLKDPIGSNGCYNKVKYL